MTAPNRRQPDANRAARPTKAERKRQLLEQAKQLFATVGYQQTSLEAIAAAANVSATILGRHFDSKPAILRAVLQELRDAGAALWQTEQTEPANLADPSAKLHALVEGYLEISSQRALEIRILQRALAESDDEDVKSLVRELLVEGESLLAAILAEGQQSGVFRRSLDPRVGAWELIRTALGYTLTLPLSIPIDGESDYLPRAIDCLLHCFLKTDV